MLSRLRGREARPASSAWNLLKTLLQTAVFWTLFLAVIPAVVYQLESALGLGGWRFSGPLGRWSGGVLFVLGGTLGLVSGIVMAVKGQGTPLPLDCPRQIVIAGPYRHVRNPMALAGIAQGIAVGLMLGSPAVVLYALSGGPLWNVLVRPWEERDLQQRFGGSFDRYREAVHCWWPRCRPYRDPPDERFSEERLSEEPFSEERFSDADPPSAEGHQP
jgi:protein-S-isoprenylcysteine O-methyltransferase Ste14